MQLAAGRARAPRPTPEPACCREPALDQGAMQSLQSAFGVFALLGIAWIISEDRRAVAWTQAAVAFIVTFVTAALLLKVPAAARAFGAINNAVDAISAASKAGTSFVFGYLGGGQLPFELKVPGADFVLALQALPIVLLMSVLTTLLFHWGILPPVVRGFSWLLERTLKVGGAAVHPSLSAEAHAQRAVHRDDRRHGRHRRDRAGGLCDLPRPNYSRCRG